MVQTRSLSDTVELPIRLAFLQIDAETKQALINARPIVMAALPGILEDFYLHLRGTPQLDTRKNPRSFSRAVIQ